MLLSLNLKDSTFDCWVAVLDSVVVVVVVVDLQLLQRPKNQTLLELNLEMTFVTFG